MRQSVNLYLPEFRKKPEWLNASRMAQVTGLVLLLLVMSVGWEFWLLFRLERDWDAAEAERAAVMAATTELRSSFGTQAPDQSVVEQNARLEAALKEKNAILGFMDGNDLGNTAGFSSYLADLARYHVQGLSLTSITLSQNGRTVALAGEVEQAELVPLYLQNLSQGASFRGLSFHALNIAEQEPAGLLEGTGQAGTVPIFQFTVSTIQ